MKKLNVVLDTNVFIVSLVPHMKYYWNSIQDDPDDNKFVDCAVTANADYVVTHDRHFRILNQVEFPVVRPITISEFQSLLT